MQWLRVLSRGDGSGDQRRARVSHDDAVDGQRHAAGNDEGLTTVRTLSTGGEQGGRDYGWPEWRPAHRRRRSPYPAMLSIRPGHESRRRQHESRRREPSAVRTAVLAISSITVTVPSQSVCSRPDRPFLNMIFSQISMATSPVICSNIVELQTSYKFIIAAVGRFLLDHSRNGPQTWIKVSVHLKFRLYQPDSLTSGLIIPNLFLTTELTFLSKVVLL